MCTAAFVKFATALLFAALFAAFVRIGRTSCVFQPVRDTAKSDKGASIKSLEG